MTLDLDTTYFPNANRDNFGKPFGQNMYNWQWFIGDRTSIISYGWFEFWNIARQPDLQDEHQPAQRPVRPQHDHLGHLDQPAAAREHLPRLHGHQHRADQHLGPERPRSATG